VNISHFSAVTVHRADTRSNPKVTPTQTHLEDTTMNRLLAALIQIALIAAAFDSNGASAEDRYRVSMENGKQRVDFSLNGNDKCVMIDDKIACAPMPKAKGQLASTESN
jgi:hypothetical protein